MIGIYGFRTSMFFTQRGKVRLTGDRLVWDAALTLFTYIPRCQGRVKKPKAGLVHAGNFSTQITPG